MACPSESQLIAMIRGAAARYGIDPTLGVAQLRRESVNFKPYYVCGPGKSPAGAQGIAQFMPDTARRFGLSNPYDPAQALEAWGKYMRFLLAKFNGRYDLALAGYNWGENRTTLAKALSEGKSVLSYSIPSETRGYVQNILGSSSLPPNVAAAPPPGSATPLPGAAPPPMSLASGGAGVLPSDGSGSSWGPLAAVIGVAALAFLLD